MSYNGWTNQPLRREIESVKQTTEPEPAMYVLIEDQHGYIVDVQELAPDDILDPDTYAEELADMQEQEVRQTNGPGDFAVVFSHDTEGHSRFSTTHYCYKGWY